MFKAGDVIVKVSGLGAGKRIYRILSVDRMVDPFNLRCEVEVIKHDTSPVGTNGTALIDLKHFVANGVTVSSLDYMNNTELSEEDKQIIKEYINGTC